MPRSSDLAPSQGADERVACNRSGVVPAGQRARLEQACRYVPRPPVAFDRIAVADDGRLLVTLRHPWADGTSADAIV